MTPTEIPVCVQAAQVLDPAADPSEATCNLFTYDASGAPLVQLVYEAGPGIHLEGCGTHADKFKISATGGDDVGYVKPCNDGITVDGGGLVDDPWCIGHKVPTPSPAGTYLGFTFDRYGHMVSTTNPPGDFSPGIKCVTPGYGIEVKQNATTGCVEISTSKPLNPVEGVFKFGCYDVTFSDSKIVNVTRAPISTSGKYTAGGVDITINECGQVTSIVPNGDDGGTDPGAGGRSNYLFRRLVTSSGWPSEPANFAFVTDVSGIFEVVVYNIVGQDGGGEGGSQGTPGIVSVSVDGESLSMRVFTQEFNTTSTCGYSAFKAAGPHEVVLSGDEYSYVVLTVRMEKAI